MPESLFLPDVRITLIQVPGKRHVLGGREKEPVAPARERFQMDFDKLCDGW